MTSEKYAVHYEKPFDDYLPYEDTSFVAGDSPVVLDIFTDLGRETYNGEINCDGDGDILVALSSDGTNYGDNVRIKQDEKLVTTTHRVKKVRITHSGSDSAYRARYW